MSDDARGRADRIRSTLTEIADGHDRVLSLIQQAKDANDPAALGYDSWAAYVAGEFQQVLHRLPRDDRRNIVQELRQLGMSTRAIAPVVGTSHEQVRQDAAAGVKNMTPATVTGADGKTYPAVRRDAPQKRRRPLPDQWRQNQRQLTTVVERYERHVSDDRFHANRQAMARQIEQLHGLIKRLAAVHEQVTEGVAR